MKYNVKNCPNKENQYLYDITDIATGKQGKNRKVCIPIAIGLGCKFGKECDKEITLNEYPSYDPDGSKANSFDKYSAMSRIFFSRDIEY